ncbi:Bud site selection protein 22 [Komagataella phaffii CBS 7435]|uniref:Mitochondrial 3-oxoacyl-[acyl-carrier-protein] reductase n=2 Tax=Komagataella phaffii TaxID=460519 RepID=C4R0Y0_KOMPG|nr:Mitochondrial 3-oxoacyl-[acyl-carrier-protein] reductase [Komagataella phaffii GS115]AOA63051.1 GQ67_00571T0 [Komagataella phaffii]CAH2448323.1 Bud site selection protein 22 [Komagataella phaffii CBS 7435]AOA67057.1 GQ68_00817T0 [Komagataella phaffii GS115]CAY69154.1 Mitochondrial 3-oxoacyl-[acyl-carrier-protein] reductase [Komagataella phaffii GS115]CCA38456.2 Bud site selection protein 22 [Komagataella phaffii CBS 7435]
MVKQDNISWKLDILEVMFLRTKPRYLKTTLFLNARNQKKVSSVLDVRKFNKNSAINQISKYKSELSERKIHSAKVKMQRNLKKVIKSETSKCQAKLKTSPDDAKQQERLQILQDIDLDDIINRKLIRILINVFTPTEELQEFPPTYLPTWVIDSIKDKNSKYNPNNTTKGDSQAKINIVSQLMNNKELREILSTIDLTLRLVEGPVERPDQIKEKREKREKKKSDDKDTATTIKKSEKNSSYSDNEAEDQDQDEDSDHSDLDDINFSKYDGALAASSDEDSDDEPATQKKDTSRSLVEDDFFDFSVAELKQREKADAKKKEQKLEKEYNLPQLTSGYFSGGESDGDYDNDKVVQEATKPRKNRRGQRARQKIWEAKYGRNANHVLKEHDRIRSEREQKQAEYEERVRKRAAKAAELRERQASMPPPKIQKVASKGLHPSWEAKKNLEKKQKNIPFQGKKVTFD